MPMQRSLYPTDWEAIAQRVKAEANWHCQSCGRACRRPGESIDEFLWRLGWLPAPDDFRIGQYTLTVAHLNHEPGDCTRSNLKALCAPCHCRYDLRQMGRKRQLKAERSGQLRIEGL